MYADAKQNTGKLEKLEKGKIKVQDLKRDAICLTFHILVSLVCRVLYKAAAKMSKSHFFNLKKGIWLRKKAKQYDCCMS